MKTLQKLGKALMLPVSVMPICGLLMGLGYCLCPAAMQGGEIAGTAAQIGYFLIRAGGALIDHIAWLFAIGVGIGLSKNNDGTGAVADRRIDISVRGMEEVVGVSGQVIAFCRRLGLDERRAFFAGLCMEEMAGNVVTHGFTKDAKPHSADIRVVHKDNELILRIRDNCAGFDPVEYVQMMEQEDEAGRNVGIRLVYEIAEGIQYQNLLGMNVLAIRI